MLAMRTSILPTFTSLTREFIISSVSFPRSAEKFSSFSLPAFFFRLPGGQTRQNAPTMKPHNRTRPFRDVRALVFFLLSASGRFDKKAVMLISNSEAEAMFEYSCNGFLCQLQRRHSCCICTMLHLTQNI